MKKLFDFSVLISVYHKECPNLFDRALNSIFSNSLKPKNVILVLDGPITDQLEKVVNKYKYNSSLIIKKLPENKGLSYALNYGLKFIRTSWVIRADSDDLNFRDRFSVLMNFVSKNPNIALAGSQTIEKSENILQTRKMPVKLNDIKTMIVYRNPFNHNSVIYQTKIIRKLGGYPNIKFLEDYGLWIMLIGLGYEAVNINIRLVEATAGRKMFKRRVDISILRSELDIYKLKCSFLKVNKIILKMSLILRVLFIISPDKMSLLIYKNLLRNKL